MWLVGMLFTCSDKKIALANSGRLAGIGLPGSMISKLWTELAVDVDLRRLHNLGVGGQEGVRAGGGKQGGRGEGVCGVLMLPCGGCTNEGKRNVCERVYGKGVSSRELCMCEDGVRLGQIR